jgi:hypothetical protein
MAIKSRWFLTVSMDIPADREELFNHLYETEHMPQLAAVPGVLSAVRSKRIEMEMYYTGKLHRIDPGNEAKYSIIYELESPDVVKTKAWDTAGDTGRWPTEIRPYATNRTMILREVISRMGED